jgi:hypothetical protein
MFIKKIKLFSSNEKVNLTKSFSFRQSWRLHKLYTRLSTIYEIISVFSPILIYYKYSLHTVNICSVKMNFMLNLGSVFQIEYMSDNVFYCLQMYK